MNLLKTAGRLLSNGASKLGKGLFNSAVDFTDSVISSTIGSDISPVRSGINASTEAIKTITTPRNESRKDTASTPVSRNPEVGESNKPQASNESYPNIVSYKNLPQSSLVSDNSDAIDEFRRHNREIERLMNEDIQLDEKLGRDKYGLDILNSEREEKDREYRRKLEDEERERLAAEELKRKSQEAIDRSKGSLEGNSAPNESNKSNEVKASSDSSSGSNLGLSILGAVTGIPGKLTKGISKILSKPLNSIGKRLASVGSTISKFTSPVTKSVSSAVKRVTNPIKSLASKFTSKASNAVGRVAKKFANSRIVKAAKFMANPKALGKLGKKMLSKIAPAIPKLAAKAGLGMAKSGVKTALKQVPLLGIALGLGEGIYDLIKGDYVGAGLATLSGVAPTLNLVAPGLGTAISMGAIGADIARDVLRDPMHEALDIFDKSTVESIESEPEVDLSNSMAVQESTGTDELTGNDLKVSNPGSSSSPWNLENVDYNVASFSQNQVVSKPYMPSSDVPGMSNYGTKVKVDALQNSKEAMNVFTDPKGLGLSPEAASGLIGCLMAESGMNPTSINKAEKFGTGISKGIKYLPTGYGAGLAQWTFDDRKNKILGYINNKYNKNYSNIEDANLTEQLNAVAWEVATQRPKVLELLKKPGITVDEATDIALRGYENGSRNALASKEFIDKYTWAGGYHGSMYGKNGRATYANSILSEISKSDPDIIPEIVKSRSNIAMTPTLLSEVDTSDKFTPELDTQSGGGDSKSGVQVNNGGDVFSPTISGGNASSVTINNFRTQDNLNIELLG